MITPVKYSGVMSPTASPALAVIRATSPLVIMPTPILRESLKLNLQSLETAPQPMILARQATATNATENRSSLRFIEEKETLRPIPAKKMGAKTMYALMSTLLSTYLASCRLQRTMPATYAPVISAMPK